MATILRMKELRTTIKLILVDTAQHAGTHDMPARWLALNTTEDFLHRDIADMERREEITKRQAQSLNNYIERLTVKLHDVPNKTNTP